MILCEIILYLHTLSSFWVNYVIYVVYILFDSGADSLGIEIQNEVNIIEQNNYELAMRISSNIKNGDTFYSDLNDLQVIVS